MSTLQAFKNIFGEFSVIVKIKNFIVKERVVIF